MTMMIEHHEQALWLGELVAAAPDSPTRVNDLAASFDVAQASEIGDSQRWLAAWADAGSRASGQGHAAHGSASDSMNESIPMMTMDGMIDDARFVELENAEGVAAGRLYLELMIEHHEGAIGAASQIFPDLRNPWVISFARHIVNEQSVEVRGMQRMAEALG